MSCRWISGVEGLQPYGLEVIWRLSFTGSGFEWCSVERQTRVDTRRNSPLRWRHPEIF